MILNMAATWEELAKSREKKCSNPLKQNWLDKRDYSASKRRKITARCRHDNYARAGKATEAPPARRDQFIQALLAEFAVPKDMLELATHVVETKKGEFDPAKFEDRYEDALKELLKKKQKGERSSGRRSVPHQTW